MEEFHDTDMHYTAFKRRVAWLGKGLALRLDEYMSTGLLSSRRLKESGMSHLDVDTWVSTSLRTWEI